MNDKPKPKVQLVGEDGNVFNLLGICIKALKRVGQYEEAQELQKRALKCGSYEEALSIMLEYVEETSRDSEEEDDDFDDDE
jgi:two-component SAPR family response regulator